MANYIEKIKVGTGEAWPIRDSEARTDIDELKTKLVNIVSIEVVTDLPEPGIAGRLFLKKVT